jgi:hypothetical protein
VGIEVAKGDERRLMGKRRRKGSVKDRALVALPQSSSGKPDAADLEGAAIGLWIDSTRSVFGRVSVKKKTARVKISCKDEYD